MFIGSSSSSETTSLSSSTSSSSTSSSSSSISTSLSSTSSTSTSSESTSSTSESTSKTVESSIISTSKSASSSFTPITTANGAFVTTIPLSQFSDATHPVATAATSVIVFTSVATSIVTTSNGHTLTIDTTVVIPTTIVTTVAAASVSYVESMTNIPVTASITTATSGPTISPAAIGFKNVIDTTNPFVGVQVMGVTVYEAGTSNSWNIISNAVTQQPVSSTIQWSLLVTFNEAGTHAVETMNFVPNIGVDKSTALLSPGQTAASFYVLVNTRLYRTSSSRKLHVRASNSSLVYVESSVLGLFNVQVQHSSSTTKTTPTITTTSTKTTSIHTGAIIFAETCSPGKKYHNPLNCCCAPKATRRVTSTRTITKSKHHNLNGREEFAIDNIPDVDDTGGKDVASKEEIYARQVFGEHLCRLCPKSLKSGSVVCCPPKSTVTKVVKIARKTKWI